MRLIEITRNTVTLNIHNAGTDKMTSCITQTDSLFAHLLQFGAAFANVFATDSVSHLVSTLLSHPLTMTQAECAY
jgi:hypothetical protein